VTFWTDAKFEPKQNFKWRVVLGEDSDTDFYATSVTKPNFQVQTKKFKNINIEENFPSNVVWSPIQVTFIDNIDNIILNTISFSFDWHGLWLADGPQEYSGYERGRKFQDLKIEMLDNSKNVIERWNLVNAIPERLEMANLDYKNDDLHTYKITFVYDWAYSSSEDPNDAKNKQEQANKKITTSEQKTNKQAPDTSISEGNARSRPEAMQFEDLFPSGPSYESAWSPTSIGINEYKSTIERGKQGARAYELGDSMTAREENYRRDSSGRRILTTDDLDK